MDSEFSKDGSYYAVIGPDGKLKIWETSTNILKNEFTPSLHLNQPFTCLQWIEVSNNQSPWRKRKRARSTDDNNTEYVALGTRSGSVLLYSPAESQLRSTLGEKNKNAVKIDCIAWAPHSGLISCGGHEITQWNISDASVKCKWKDDKKEKATAVLVVPEKPYLVTAFHSIKLWNFKSQELLFTFVGHASNVNILRYVPATTEGAAGYLISSAIVDRFLGCWNLDTDYREKTAVSRFIMEDVASHVTVYSDEDGVMNMAATVRSGFVHVYKQILNGSREKPIKPKVTIQIATERENSKEVAQIPILGAFLNPDFSARIVYGSYNMATFEKIVLSTTEKILCLVRNDPRKFKTKPENHAKVKIPEINKDVEYVFTNNSTGLKRKTANDNFEVPMEKRLENLVLNKPESSSGVPSSDNMANLLIQGLRSKDFSILQTVFCSTDAANIKNTIKRMPVEVLPILITELSSFMQKRLKWNKLGTTWLKEIVYLHASQLIANPDLSELMSPTLDVIEKKLGMFPHVLKLRGRLDMLVSQITTSKKENQYDKTTLVYQDHDSSESSSDENIDMEIQSDSDDQWEENSENESENENNSDVDMSNGE